MKLKLIYLVFIFFINSYSQNITLDNNFGNNGILEIPFDSSGSDVSKCKILSNGKIIFLSTRINGSNLNEVFITQINTDGTIDTTFGTNGFVFLNLQHYHDNYLKIQSDNKILIYGDRTPAKLIRLNPNGDYDNSFATNGVLEFPNNSYHSEDNGLFSTNNIVLQTDGKILIRFIQDLNGIIKIKRLNIDGTPDNSFATNSELIGSVSNAIFLGNDSKILGFSSSSNSYTIEKINIDGTFDNTFGINGVMTYTLPYTDFETKYLFKDNLGRFIIEKLNLNTTLNFDAFRLNENGELDITFGANGFISFSDFQTLIVPIFNSNSKYYFGGSTIVSNNIDNQILMRFNDNGNIDNSFNSVGYYIESTNSINEFSESINIQSDGKILTSGEYTNGTNKKLYLIRYNSPTLGTEEFNENDIKIVNPIKTKLEITSNNNIKSISLFNIKGQLIFSNLKRGDDLQYLNQGLYVLKIKFDNGIITNYKLIKE